MYRRRVRTPKSTKSQTIEFSDLHPATRAAAMRAWQRWRVPWGEGWGPMVVSHALPLATRERTHAQ
eukprot:5716902-Prymnesium_polylepis.1